ncbi:hypothetical protein [Pseudomonas syringae]|uniref:hypothetical protein n=1 Tax=Pseudomonas syringae TaxID=317 RepID=UPI003F7573D2
MGKYSKMLSERGKHTKIVSGYCVICGRHGSLSKDHVPPQGSITVTMVEQFHLTEVIVLDRDPVQGIPSMNGSKFRTICRECNMTALGANDGEVADVCRSLTRKINHFFTAADSPVSCVHTPVNAVKYCRAMIGHILAATSVTECRIHHKKRRISRPCNSLCSVMTMLWMRPVTSTTGSSLIGTTKVSSFSLCEMTAISAV